MTSVISIIVLFIVSILTFLTCIVIIYQLKLFPNLQLVSVNEDNDLVFNENARIDQILLQQSAPLNLSQLSGNIRIKSGSSYLNFGHHGLEICSSNGLNVYSSSTGKLLYPFNKSHLQLSSIPFLLIPGGVKNVHKIRSPSDNDLKINSKQSVSVSGNEGVSIHSKQLHFKAHSINLTSLDAEITLNGRNGIIFDSSPILNNHSKLDDEKFQYKICICAKNGRMFKLKLKDASNNCADVRFPESFNPCN